MVVVESTGVTTSANPIWSSTERNEEDTVWTRTDDTRPATVKNTVKVEDIARVHKRKEVLSKEVAKNDQSSLVDRCLWNKVRQETWDNYSTTFPQRKTS